MIGGGSGKVEHITIHARSNQTWSSTSKHVSFTLIALVARGALEIALVQAARLDAVLPLRTKVLYISTHVICLPTLVLLVRMKAVEKLRARI